MMRPLAVTMGDPAGIGGELTLRAWHALHRGGLRFAVLDDAERLTALARALSLDVPIARIDSMDQTAPKFAAALPVLHVPLAAAPRPGHPDKANAQAVLASIERATQLALSGEAG